MALLRLVAALAVMLLAVLPHATLAASAFHTASSAMPGMANHHDAMPTGHHADTPTPCHDEEAGKSGPSMPSCCILGCGLLGSGPAIDVVAVAARWRLLAPAPAHIVAGVAPEPAERPPRHPAR